MEYSYHLIDNGGVSTVYLPIVLNIGTQFEHEFGLYKIEAIEPQESEPYAPQFLCERIDTTQHLTEALEKRKSFYLKNPNT
jgi:hypothetical protein